MNIVVVGCGRVGASLARIMDTQGNEVSVVDVDRGAFSHLTSEFQGRCVVGQGFDEEVLREAGIDS